MAGVTDDLSAGLAELAAAYGVATEFWDWRGQHTRAPGATVTSCVVTRSGTASQVFVHVAHGASVQVSVQPEDGSSPRRLAQVDRYVHPRPIDGALVVYVIDWPAITEPLVSRTVTESWSVPPAGT